MCYSVRCTICGKTTWAGCGDHIPAVKATIPASQWCPGHSSSTPDWRTGSRSQRLFAKLFSRR